MLLMWPVKEHELHGASHVPGETVSAINLFSTELKGLWFVYEVGGGPAGWGIALQVGRLQVRFRMELLDISLA